MRWTVCSIPFAGLPLLITHLSGRSDHLDPSSGAAR